MTARRGATLLLAAALAALFSAYVALTGGLDTQLAGIPLRSRSWERPALLALLLGAAGLIRDPRPVLALLRLATRATKAAHRHAGQLPLLAVAWVACAAIAFGTHAAGGADSYGYVSQAELLAAGRLTDPLPSANAFRWPDVPSTLTPLGYKVVPPGRSIAPTYPPGLPILMAPLAAAHPMGVFLVVPLCAALAVFFCYRLGRQLGEPLAGTLAAFLLALSPTFLYQAVQPMSDVPVTACWLGALVMATSPARWSALATGVIVSLAILIRPNLAPLALAVVTAAAVRSARFEWRRAVLCGLAMAPGLLVLGVIQHVRFGSPFASGYGPIADLFAFDNIVPNLTRYPRWLIETHTIFIWIWLLAPVWIRRAAPQVRMLAWIVYIQAAAVLVAYLPYAYFRPEEWFYTRFLLPAIPLFLLLGMLVVTTVARRISGPLARPIAIAVALTVAVVFGVRSVQAGTFGLRDVEQKYPLVGGFVREHLPADAFVLAMQHSGSVRYYAGRHTLRWDLLDEASLALALASLREAGYTPFAVLDPDEDLDFRMRFKVASADALGTLKPIGTVRGTRIYAFH